VPRLRDLSCSLVQPACGCAHLACARCAYGRGARSTQRESWFLQRAYSASAAASAAAQAPRGMLYMRRTQGRAARRADSSTASSRPPAHPWSTAQPRLLPTPLGAQACTQAVQRIAAAAG